MTFQSPLNAVQSLLITSFFTSNLINLKCTLEKIQYRENICTSVLSYFTLYGLSGQAKLLRAGASCKCFIRLTRGPRTATSAQIKAEVTGHKSSCFYFQNLFNFWGKRTQCVIKEPTQSKSTVDQQTLGNFCGQLGDNH